MTRYAKSAERFAADTTNHQMTVLRDDGLYRHLRFVNPDSGLYWFELVTWPGRLAFNGDMDGFTFARVDDMFTFFRSGSQYGINPGYWAEKVTDGRERCAAFSEDKFRIQVEDTVSGCEDDFPGLGAAVKDAMDNDYSTYLSEGAREFLRDFTYITDDGQKRVAAARTAWSATCGRSGVTHEEKDVAWAAYQRVESDATFQFLDWQEWDLTDWSWNYLWVCHAITWGIRQYDEAKPAVRVEAVAS